MSVEFCNVYCIETRWNFTDRFFVMEVVYDHSYFQVITEIQTRWVVILFFNDFFFEE